MNKKVVAIIPARGGSKRFPKKNIYPFLGKPLIRWSIEACQKSKYISDVYISTENAEIKEISRNSGAKIIDRPAHLAEDQVWAQEVMKHAVNTLEKDGVKIDLVARIYASAQIKAEKIDEAIEKLAKHNLWEVFSVNREGLEDTVIHILRRDCVFQEALSVYKGVVFTDYIDVHTKEDLDKLKKREKND
jgi:N-acylneuraminate cytidylyltransferase